MVLYDFSNIKHATSRACCCLLGGPTLQAAAAQLAVCTETLQAPNPIPSHSTLQPNPTQPNKHSCVNSCYIRSMKSRVCFQSSASPPGHCQQHYTLHKGLVIVILAGCVQLKCCTPANCIRPAAAVTALTVTHTSCGCSSSNTQQPAAAEAA